VKGHAYTISNVACVNARGRNGPIQVNLLRVRNPWGKEREWNGPWSDSSPEWKLLSEQEKRSLGLTFDHDGEFWISVDDFIRNFTKLEICMLSPHNCGEVDGQQWEILVYEGEWQAYVTAGGCRNYPDTFHTNPQFRITLEDPDEDDDLDKCQLVVGLLQKDRRKLKLLGKDNLTIGFAIYKVDSDAKQYIVNGRLSKDFFLYNKMVAKSDSFVNAREVVGRFSLDPGNYVVIPSTFYPHEEGQFLLRMVSEKKREGEKMDTKTKIEKKKPVQNPNEGKWIDDTLRKTFERVSGQDEVLDAFELRQAMNMVYKEEYGSREEFGLEASRSMLIFADSDKSGKIDLREFKMLYRTVVGWRNSFKEYDRDKSGDMDTYELRDLLSTQGFTVGTDVLASLVRRYSNKKGRVNFDDFVQICCRVKSVHDAFKKFNGKSYTEDDFLRLAIYT